MPNLVEVAANGQCDATVNVFPPYLSSTGFLCSYPHDSTVVNILDGTVVYILDSSLLMHCLDEVNIFKMKTAQVAVRLRYLICVYDGTSLQHGFVFCK